MNYLPTCTSRLVVQHLYQVSFKSMQGCRRSWEDKLKCVKILSVKDHNSAKICRTWITSPHALLDLWCNICTKFHSNPCKDVGGVEKTNFDVTEGRNDGMTEGRKDGMMDKANNKCPLAILWRGHKKRPKGPHIVHLSTICHHFCLQIGPKNTNLVEDVETLLSVKFHWIPFSGFWGEVENVSANQRPGRPSCFPIGTKNTKLGRGCSNLAFCKVWLNSIQQVQRRSRKCLSQSEARAAILLLQSARKTQTW